jgi:hypothetical protein
VGADDAGIDTPEVALDETLLIQLQEQGVEDLGPGAVLAPGVEAIVDGFPGSVTFGSVRPRSAGVQMLEDAAHRNAVVLPRVTGTAMMITVGEERLNPLPLGVGEVIAIHGWPPCGNLPAREMGLVVLFQKVIFSETT